MKKVTSILMAVVLAVTSLLSVNMIAYTSDEDSTPDFGSEYYNAGDIEVGETKLVAPFDDYRYFVYRFAPEADVNADFFSNCNGNPDTYAELYDSNGDFIMSNDDSNGLDFKVSYHFEAGQVYYLAARPYSGQDEFYVTFKADTFDHFTYTRIAPLVFFENSYGNLIDDDYGEEYFDYIYDSEPLTGDVLTVYYNDGTPETEFVYNRNNHAFISEDNIQITDFVMFSNQYEEHWSVGTDNYLIFEYHGVQSQIPVTIKENTIASVELIRENPIILMENLDSSTNRDENDNEYQHYYYNPVIPGDVLRVTDNDGTYADYEFIGDDSFYNSEEGSISIDPTYNMDDQYENHWEAGIHEYTISVLGFLITGEVEVIPDQTTGISFEFSEELSLDPSECSNINAFVRNDENDEPYICVESDFDIGPLDEYFSQNVQSLTLYFNDGTSKVYQYQREERDEAGYFVADTGEVIFEYEIAKNLYYDEDNQPRIQLELLRYEYIVNGTLTNNDVESISFEPAEPWSFVERTSGFEYRDGFIYNEYGIEPGDELTVNYKDGSTKIFVFTLLDEYEEDGETYVNFGFVSEDGEVINNYYIIDTQYDYFWEPGGKVNFVVLAIADTYCLIPVEIIGTTISSISYTPAASFDIIEGTNCFETRDEDNNFYYHYYVTDFPADGDVLTVTNNDGTVDVYTCRDTHFYNDLGNIIDFGSASNNLKLNDNQYYNHWTVGGSNYLYVTYMGKEAAIPVQINTNPVVKIQYTPSDYNRYNLMLNTNGQWDVDNYGNEYFNYAYPGVSTDDTLTVWYTDGTVVTYTAVYDSETHTSIFTSENGDIIPPEKIDIISNQNMNHWYPDTFNKVVVEYSGRQDYVQVTIAKADLDFTRFDEIMNEAREREYMICYLQDDNFWALDDLTSATHDSFETQAEVDNYVDEVRQAIDNLTLVDSYTDSADGITWTWKDGTIYLECEKLPTYPSEYAPWRDFREFTNAIYTPCDLGWDGVGFDGFILENGVTFAHDFVYDHANSGGELMYECSRCDSHQKLDVDDVVASWDIAYANHGYGAYDEQKSLDVVHDGIINAKDFAMLKRLQANK